MGIEGFVLAGGQSRRMGRDKAWLPLEGRALVAWTVERLGRATDRVAAVGGDAPRLRALGVTRVLPDLAPGEGPLMGVYTGLMDATEELCVFVPCDTPLLVPRLVRLLTDACAAGAPAAAGVHPLDGLQPFPLAIRRDAVAAVGGLLDGGQRAMRALFTLPGARVIPVEDAVLWPSFVNVNTEADYAALRR